MVFMIPLRTLLIGRILHHFRVSSYHLEPHFQWRTTDELTSVEWFCKIRKSPINYGVQEKIGPQCQSAQRLHDMIKFLALRSKSIWIRLPVKFAWDQLFSLYETFLCHWCYFLFKIWHFIIILRWQISSWHTCLSPHFEDLEVDGFCCL